MDDITAKTINALQGKIDWAIKSNKDIMNNLNNKSELQQAFWAFLASFRPVWSYFCNLNNEKHPELSTNQKSSLNTASINEWKKSYLTLEEATAWDVLLELRNTDVHNEPVLPNYEIRTRVLTYKGKVLVSKGKVLITKSKVLFVIFKGKEYKIDVLTKNGISSMQKLIEYLPHLK